MKKISTQQSEAPVRWTGQWPMALGMLFILIGLMMPVPRSPEEAGRILLGSGFSTEQDLKSWLEEHPIKANQPFRIDSLTRTARSSSAIAQILKREEYHRHMKHDLTVTLLRGKGRMLLDGKIYKVQSGDVVHIPAGMPHAFLNGSSRKLPAVALAVFVPPFDGKDSVVTKEKAKD